MFEMESCYAVQAGSKFWACQPPPPQCWDDRQGPTCLTLMTISVPFPCLPYRRQGRTLPRLFPKDKIVLTIFSWSGLELRFLSSGVQPMARLCPVFVLSTAYDHAHISWWDMLQLSLPWKVLAYTLQNNSSGLETAGLERAGRGGTAAAWRPVCGDLC